MGVGIPAYGAICAELGLHCPQLFLLPNLKGLRRSCPCCWVGEAPEGVPAGAAGERTAWSPQRSLKTRVNGE